MEKSSEEGRIWEWRAFGTLGPDVVSAVERYPIRLGIREMAGEDLYFISPGSDQNVKLRRGSTGWALKFKTLLEVRRDTFELYDERSSYTYQLPIEADIARNAARLLSVELRDGDLDDETLDKEALVRVLSQATPAVWTVLIKKKRSQFAFQNGWLELADVQFPGRKTRSISIHSAELSVVTNMLRRLSPGRSIEAMNYVQACRRWGEPKK